MGRFQTSVMVSVLSGALVFGAIGVGATGASAESGGEPRPELTQVAAAGCEDLNRYVQISKMVPYLETLYKSDLGEYLTDPRQRSSIVVSVAFINEVNKALNQVGVGEALNKQGFEQMIYRAEDLATDGDPAVALVGLKLADSIREYAAAFESLDPRANKEVKRELKLLRQLPRDKRRAKIKEYKEPHLDATRNMRDKQAKLRIAVDAARGLCGWRVKARNACNADRYCRWTVVPYKALTRVPTPQPPQRPQPQRPQPPQPPTTTTTYPATTTTTDPYCYEHPDLGRICE